MGQKIFKPNKIPIKFERSKSNTNELNGTVNGNVNTSNNTADGYSINLEIINAIYKKYININTNSDTIDDNLLPRTLRSHPTNIIDVNDDTSEIQMLEVNDEMTFFTELYSMEDLVRYLGECSSSDGSPKSSNGWVEENLPRLPLDVIFKGKNEDIETLTPIELQTLFKEDVILLLLSEKSEYTPKLKLLLDKAATSGMITEFIDLPVSNGNPAISIAFLNSNLEAFCYLIRRKASIPMFIYLEETKMPFLNYIAMHGRLSIKGNSTKYLLLEVLQILIKDYPTEYIKNYLCEIDNNYGLSLPHLLLAINQTSPDLQDEITECLKLCVKAYPECIKVLCISHYCLTNCLTNCPYKFNAIAHSIILPITNYEILKVFMQLPMTEEDRSIYRSLVKVHQDKSTQERILEIIG